MADEIRILALEPAKDYFAPLAGCLAHIPLYGDTSYLAVSYTWGDNQFSRSMKIHHQIIPITANLEDALRGLRSKEAPQFVWIDALCINQQDEKEKSRQIPRMQEIYDHAIAVFSRPGRNTKLIQKGMRFVQELGQPKLTVWEKDHTGNSSLKYTARLAKAWAALYEVFRQPFFGRRWIVQEFASSNLPNIVTPGGRKVFHWQKLYNAACTFEDNLEKITDLWHTFYSSPLKTGKDIEHAQDNEGIWSTHKENPFETYKEIAYADWEKIHCNGLNDVQLTVRSIKILSYIRHPRASGKPPTFLLLLVLTQTFDCTDSRDKLYSLWNLANDAQCLNIRPDYSRSTAKVYRDFVKAYCKHQKCLDLICTTQFSFNAASTPLVPDPGPDHELYSSWCPDWRQGPHLHTFVRKSMFGYELDKIEEVPYLDYSPYHADCLLPRPDTDKWNGCQGCTAERLDAPLTFTFEGWDLLASGVILDTVTETSQYPID